MARTVRSNLSGGTTPFGWGGVQAIAVAAALSATSLACSGREATGPTPIVRGPAGGTADVIVVGDIGVCGEGATAATARLVAGMTGQLLLAGDIAYPHGSATDFRQCFDPDWGRFRGRWHAVPGNHEYETPGAAAFFDYFGDAAGTDRTGYFALQMGDWQVLMLNSNVPSHRGTDQWEFARRELTLDRRACAMAVWHHPLFSSGPNGPTPAVRELYDLLALEGVELVVNGHEHLYERFARLTADGRPSERGVRQFTVGTGGAALYPFHAVAPGSESRVAQHGVLRLNLQPGGYRWEFTAITGAVPDSGMEACH